MTPLPPPLDGGEFIGWRLDQRNFSQTWDSGEGAYRLGGRWNSRGVAAVYCSVDPATAILEVAVHKGFKALDTVPHVLTAMVIIDLSAIHVVNPAAIPNPNWLRPGILGVGQQAFGDDLPGRYKFVLMPSAVSIHSWNLLFIGITAAGAYAVESQEMFALDTRLHPSVAL